MGNLEKMPNNKYYLGDKVYIIWGNAIHRVTIYGVKAVSENEIHYYVKNSFLNEVMDESHLSDSPEEVCELLKTLILD